MNKLKYIFGTALLALSITSCSDFLDQEPTSEIPAGEMWQTARDAKAGINELYGLFRTTMRQNYFYWGEFRSDNVGVGAPVMADQARVINNVMSTDEYCGKWTDLYKVINQANLAIKYIPGISMPNVADRNDYLAQAYAMRALAYFYAVRVWGDVPLFTEPVEKYSQDIYRERTSADYILKEVILKDLKTAEGLINPENRERKRISPCGVLAIMADVYMWLQEYSLADQTIEKMAEFKNKDTKPFVSLESDIQAWSKMFTEELNGKPSDDTYTTDDYTSKELIFLVHFDMDEVGTNGYSYMYQWFTGSGNRAAVASQKFVNIFNEADMQGDLRKDYLFKDYQNGMEIRKYISGDISSTLNKTCEVGYPIYRYSDMILLQAEARVHQGKWEEALDLVKKIRDRAGLQTKIESDFASEQEVLEYIWRERQVELLNEGRRWFDLRRTNTWKEVMGPINGLQNDGNELFPIHYSHIIENPKIKQNSYYGNN